MLTVEERAKNDQLVLTMLTKTNGEEVESVDVDGNGNYYLLELIEDQRFIQRNAMPEEIAAYHQRVAERAQADEAERTRKAEESERLSQEIHAKVLATVIAHPDGRVRLRNVETQRVYEFDNVEEAADFASWNVERVYEQAPESVAEVEEETAEPENQASTETA